jgi:hypothetical protein
MRPLAAEKINEPYVGRVLRLTLLSPDIVQAILNGRQAAGLQLDLLLQRFPVAWKEKRAESPLKAAPDAIACGLRSVP